MNVNHIIVAKYDPRKENNNLFQQKILFIFPIWRMRSNNADLVSLNQTICHWKKVLNKRIFRCLCVCVYIRIWTRKSVVEFEFITFSTFLEEKIQWLLSTKEMNQCYNWKLQKYNICNIGWPRLRTILTTYINIHISEYWNMFWKNTINLCRT